MSRLCCSRFERAARKLGWTRIAGLDEAGRGALFGPVVAAAVILNPKRRIVGLDDSKQLAPERRFYQASQTSSTMVALHSTLERDLYVIYEGKNPDTDKPIIKVFLNPLMNWIWIGVLIVVAGTGLALVPSLTRAPVRVAVVEPVLVAEVHHA